MSEQRIVTEDISAILDALRGDAALAALVNPDINGQPNPEEHIEHSEVESGVTPPYIIVIDIALDSLDTFGGHSAAENGYYAIRCITQNTVDKSAYTVAADIQKAIAAALHGVDIPADNGVKTLAIRRGAREPMWWEDISSEVRYLHTGWKWFGTFAVSQ